MYSSIRNSFIGLTLFVGIAAVLAPAVAQAQSILYVDADAMGNNDGSSWADAYTDLQDALAAATSNDEIWIAEGTYTPTAGTNRDTSFTVTAAQDGLTIYGGFGGTETDLSERDVAAHPVVLSGDIGAAGDSTDNSRHVLYFDGTVAGGVITTATVLDGVTVTDGNASGGNGPPENKGGGLRCDGSGAGNACSPTIRNVIFSGNSAQSGGGAIFNIGVSGGESSPMITNSTFSGNTAGFGGAILNDGNGGTSSPTITNSTFSGNSATREGGAIFNVGYFNGTSSPTITNSTFSGNTAQSGGAIHNDGNNGTSSPTITNTILWGNSANSGDEIYNVSATPTISHTLIDGGCPAGSTCNDVIDADPLFADTTTTDGDGLDLRLKGPAPGRDASPAIDVGTPDTTGLGLPPVDLAGEPRVAAVLGTEAVVDLGAYESTGAPLPVELAAFEARIDGEAVVLSWRTLSEHGSDRFEVQRAVAEIQNPAHDLRLQAHKSKIQNWQTIAAVDAAGTSTGAQPYTFTDAAVPFSADTLLYRLRQVDLDGTATLSAVVEVAPGAPEAFALYGSFPNPFVRSTTIRYALPEARHVRLTVYDVLGRRVRVLVDERQAADAYEIPFDAAGLSAGVYFVRLTAGDDAETRRMVVVR